MTAGTGDNHGIDSAPNSITGAQRGEPEEETPSEDTDVGGKKRHVMQRGVKLEVNVEWEHETTEKVDMVDVLIQRDSSCF